MKKCLRFQLYSAMTNLAVLSLITVALMALCQMFGTESGLGGLLANYLTAYPILCAIVLMVSAASAVSNDLNTALSMGATRRSFFGAYQLTMLVYVAVAWVLQFAVDTFSQTLGARTFYELTGTPPSRNFTVSLVLLVTLLSSALLGRASTNTSKWKAVLGGLLMGVLFLFLIVGVFVAPGSKNWGSLPWILPAVSVVLIMAEDFLLWRTIKKAVVR